MLKINHKTKYQLFSATALMLGVAFLFLYLAFLPEYSYAESISTTTPVTLPKIEGVITNKFGTAEQGYKTYLQEIDLKYCQSLPVGTTGQLADGRDGKIYWVTVLGTGAAKTCWMTQDLDLDLKGMTITTTNDGDNMYKGSDANWTGGNIDSKSSWTKNTNDVQWYERDKTHGTEHTSLGNLYSYEAATAGTGHSTTTDYTEVSGSICPAGWKLPLSGGSSVNKGAGSFNSLKDAGMTSNSAANGSPYYFQYGGYIGGSLNGVGYEGNYWSATSLSSSYAYNLNFNAYGNFNTASNSNRYYGYSVRCVVRDASYTAPTMPTPSESDLNNPNVSVTVDKILTMELTTKEVNIEPKNGEIMTGDFGATISSNADYTLSITAAENSSTSLVNKKDNVLIAEIPTIPAETSALTPNENHWAIRLCNDTNKTNCNDYKPITPYGTTNIFLTNGTPAINSTALFEVGIGTSSSLPSGTYSTNILVTASQK